MTVDGQAATVTIAWTLPDENTAAVGFRLNGDTTIECAETATASGSCQLTEVPPGSYAVEYREDEGSWTDADADADVPVAPPVAVTATPTLHGLTVAWGPSPSPGVTGYVATATPVGGEPVSCQSTTGCALTGLTYREYTVSVVAKTAGPESEGATVAATPLPETPPAPTGVTAKLSGPNAITISWKPVTSALGVPIKYMGGIGAENWGTGCWDEPRDALTCTVDDLPAGTAYTITAYAIGDVMSEPGRAAAKLTIPLPSSIPDGAPPMRSDLDGADPAAGDSITISGTGYQPYSTVLLAIYSEPVTLGSATVEDDGTFSATVKLPDGYVGEHSLLASGTGLDGKPRYMQLALTIAAGGGGGLPVTGTPVALLLALGAGLVLGGGGLLTASRPRRALTTA
ncbi:fibronectin type III domain-containing protein [Jidongwangia harbinensis]|uniref:fibronectin type III domain-containing protein n=1 Tax=Jidongwangia harbinensis TaxID=2878561 RepID=UPI001CD97A42|nr:fibronectin type III domain-containing protein [Jidongwangia harbinensis]MCA2218535.1 fibronectin type III domain-containing protein [Jidongwangia harbinensis]